MASENVSDDAHINIRTRLHTDGNTLCKAGGGVVSNSRCEIAARTRRRDIAGHLGFESATQGFQVRRIWLLPVKISIVQLQVGLNTYITAARRQAGGVAATKLARAVMAMKTKLEGYMAPGYYFGYSDVWSRKTVCDCLERSWVCKISFE
jgi:hypothetical protein